jgi:uncharacterized protein (TIGR02466 family)
MSEKNIDEMLNLTVYPVLAKPIAVGEYKPSKELQNYLTNVELKHPVGAEPPGYGAVSKNIMILRDEICSDLREKILYAGKEFAHDLLGIDTNDMIDVLSWVTVKRPNNEHQAHAHPNSIISGVYFFDDHTENMPLHFLNRIYPDSGSDFILRPKYFPPSSLTGVPDAPFSRNAVATVHVSKGTLVLFPSTLVHQVALNTTPFSRYSLAFNLLPKEGLGCPDELTRFNYGDVL